MANVAIGPVFVKVCRPCAGGALTAARFFMQIFGK
jgi:hypothetical protein